MAEISDRPEPASVMFTTPEGYPAGGLSQGKGFTIGWQNGTQESNGATVENVLRAAKQRIEFFQRARGGQFSCAENADAIHYIDRALSALDRRTMRRRAAATEGTYEGA